MPLGRATLLFNPRFLRFAWRRARAGVQEYVRQFEQSQTGDVDSLMYSPSASVTNYTYLRRAPTSYVWPNASMITPEETCQDETGIYLGEATFIGRRVRIEVGIGDRVEIGNFSRINDNCALHGNVRISPHCVLASNIHISSGTHQFRHRPTWLINDQDADIAGHPGVSHDAPVIIEEDCWVGNGVVILPGVYVGRGSVIGANSVVTRDIAPYTVHAGVPNRQISVRLPFNPPTEALAANDNHWPYYYSGFGLRQMDLAGSLALGGVFAQPKSRIVLAGGRFAKIRFQGWRQRISQSLRVRVALNCNDVGAFEVLGDDFDQSLPLTLDDAGEGCCLPAPLREFNVVDLQVDHGSSPQTPASFGLVSVSLA
jgi:acetyltransferase-like isoleucine patch superfamily enzyme